MKLRPWQEDAVQKALTWFVDKKEDNKFLINAAPGAGKTIAACSIAQALIERGEVERLVVIAPRAEVVQQWADDVKQVTGRTMLKVTGADDNVKDYQLDVCATWAAIQGLADAFQAVCMDAKTLVICDEHHHAAVRAAWGEGANGAFAAARYALILTGTPIRSDNQESVWLAFDDEGAIAHPEEGTYTLTYGDAVDLGYCRPITFHRHEGKFTVDLDDGQGVQVSGASSPELSPELKRIPGLQRALNFYRLACTPQYERDGETPLHDGYQATMLEYASDKLTELRYRMPNAGGLVIAPSIEVAKYMARLIEIIEGEKPTLVHSQESGVESKIKAFKNTDKRWIVSVAMISEGVDIKRLRVLVYLPNALTELAFRQSVGRVVRTLGPDDDTRAYVVMPSFETFERFARRVEEEMPPAARKPSEPPKSKKCPTCNHECSLSDKECPECGHEFSGGKPPQFKPCPHCEQLNPQGATTCQACGQSLVSSFNVSLDEALRTGAIIRGMDLDEHEVQEGERIAPAVREKVLKSGDDKLVRMVSNLPDESFARLRDILSDEEK
jgi:superfamily II DNA or RNA helicase